MKKCLSFLLAAVMLLSCMGLTVAADEMVTTSAPASDDGWYQFEQTIISEVIPAAGENYTFTSDSEPLYKGVDTAGNIVAIGKFSADMNNSKVEKIKTDENGVTYTEGDGNWNGRNSDGGYFIYQYRLAQGATQMKWTATIGGQYGVYVWVGGDVPEADESKWVRIAYFGGDGNGPNGSLQSLEYDLGFFDGLADATHLYIKMKDEVVPGGYGGRIAMGTKCPITLFYDVDAPAVEYDPAQSGDGSMHEMHSFFIATEDEKAYLYDDKAHYNGDKTIHYADKTAYFVYLYNIENYQKMTSVSWTAMAGQQLYLQVSNDGATWTDVFKWEGELKENGSGVMAYAYTTYDLTPYIDLSCSTVYVKISDSYPEKGWGGAINNTMPVVLDVVYEELTDEEKAALEAEEQARKEAEEAARLEAEKAEEAARLEAEKAAAKAEAQGVIDQINELADLTLESLNEDNYKEAFQNIRVARRAYNGLSDAAVEIVNESDALAILEAAEAVKAEYEAILEAKENEPTEDPADPADPVDPADPTEPKEPADEDQGGLSPVVIAVIAVAVIAVVVIVIIATKKKKE